MTVSERTAGALLAEAHELTASLPLTLAALQAGSISWQHARAMVDETSTLDPPAPRRWKPTSWTPTPLTPPAAAPQENSSRPGSGTRPGPGGNATTRTASKPATPKAPRTGGSSTPRTATAWPGSAPTCPPTRQPASGTRATAAARALQGPTEPRTLTQLRADTAATWLLRAGGESASGLSTAHPTAENSTIGGVGTGGVGTGGVPSPAAQVLITVPVFSLLGLTDEPAVLDGYGPIPATMACRLIADGADSFHRVLTDPRTGAPLEIGRTSYRVPKAMRQWLRLRDGKCPFPGCSNHSLDNEADHLLAWNDGGTTGITNLGQPCRKHHRLKHTTSWTPTGAGPNEPPGWTSPTGRHYQSEQQDWEPTPWPEALEDLQLDAALEPGLESDAPEDLLPDEAWPLESLEDPCRTGMCGSQPRSEGGPASAPGSVTVRVPGLHAPRTSTRCGVSV
ncbi:hypothetical protein QFZ30_003957 [Arthrobacter pascens]|nr:hypothetical protein [Arthrobacter pascens]